MYTCVCMVRELVATSRHLSKKQVQEPVRTVLLASESGQPAYRSVDTMLDMGKHLLVPQPLKHLGTTNHLTHRLNTHNIRSTTVTQRLSVSTPVLQPPVPRSRQPQHDQRILMCTGWSRGHHMAPTGCTQERQPPSPLAHSTLSLSRVRKTEKCFFEF